MSLSEALDRAIKVYSKEKLHAAPLEVVANAIGYKNANSGTALSALASLRYYGLLERPKEGFLAASKDVQAFIFAPSEDKRKELLIQFLKRPPLYAELLDKYQGGLPSEATVRYDLIERGFAPTFANSALTAFKQSIEFAGYFDTEGDAPAEELDEDKPEISPERLVETAKVAHPTQHASTGHSASPEGPLPERDVEGFDRIPVRLSGGRRAWLVIPTPFFQADKARLKAHIDLLLSDDDEDE